MDPNNIHSQSSSLLGLLHSQQGSVYHENFPHESFHGRINFGDSQPIPSFSSQPSQVLISVWLNTSKDSIVANEQKSGTFWDRVAHLYSSSPHGLEDGEREPGQCKKRWHRINDDVNKFCAAYSASERQLRSGESDTDLLKKAHEIFFADQAKKFTLEHAWCTLRFEQKWLSLNAPKAGGGEKRKNVETTTQASTTDGVVDVDPRPEGIKAAKARRNGGKGKSVSDYVSVWEMKKEDWEMKKEDLERKERLSKLSILDTLLAKTEPLSEAEEAVYLKMGRYSYSQPSPSKDMFGNNSDSEYSETDDLIRRDQTELSLERRSSVIYPPQPEVEFGFPQVCYCGSPPQLVPSRSIIGQVYTCTNKDDGECHVWKWWDVAVMEEMRARDRHVLQLEEK
uniref:Uncharacterized protein n=1 Tax=Brassica oleracea var. oleracea TaxID=109376 RepID=A0A0D3A2C8_BRAOL